jgi:hypothetical protein
VLDEVREDREDLTLEVHAFALASQLACAGVERERSEGEDHPHLLVSSLPPPEGPGLVDGAGRGARAGQESEPGPH